MLIYRHIKKNIKARKQISTFWLKNIGLLHLCWKHAGPERVQDDCVRCVWQFSATKPQQTKLPLSYFLSAGLVSFCMNRYSSWNPILTIKKYFLPSFRTYFTIIQRAVKRQKNSHRKKTSEGNGKRRRR